MPARAKKALADAAATTPAQTQAEPQGGRDAEPLLSAHLERVVRSYRLAGRALRAGDPPEWGSGLTMTQLRVLYFVGRGRPVSVSEVAAEIGVTQPSATESLERLERLGLIERATDQTDRRVIRSRVTPSGRELIDRPWETRRAVLASALRHASPGDRESICRGLELLCDALGAIQPPEHKAPDTQSGRAVTRSGDRAKLSATCSVTPRWWGGRGTARLAPRGCRGR